jgi:rod shape-determining protein MreC
MLDALRIIVKNGSIILFLVLQLLCLFWIVTYNQKQGEIYFFSLQLAADALEKKVQNVTSYISLRDQISEVREENAALLQKFLNEKQHQASLPATADSSDSTTGDLEASYRVLAANVINNSISRKNNYLTLDKGGAQGVNPGMAVITSKSIVGIVTDTSRHFSLAMSLLHSNSRISAKLKRSGFFGSLIWKESDPRNLSLEDIQKYADVLVGDTVVTSGFSIIFPEGLPIGIVTSLGTEPGAFTYSIRVRLFESLSSVRSVYLIDNRYKDEKEELEKKRQEDD